jgi:hypothetical protein
MSRYSHRRFAHNSHLLALASLACLAVGSCVVRGDLRNQTARLRVTVAMEDGTPLPGPEQPMPLSLKGPNRFVVTLEALDAYGMTDTLFNGFVRVSVEPGGVSQIIGPDVVGRNVMMRLGRSLPHVVEVTGAYGTTRIWAEDMGYLPADPLKMPQCSDGLDNNGNGLIDYPADPGCAFANDDTEDGGTYAAGVSAAVHFELPTVAQVQGFGSNTPSKTPFANEQVEIRSASPATLIVTRVSSDGFYVTDINPNVPDADKLRYASIFAFNFNSPWGMRVCDRLDYLSGTMSEFFGFTELGFPSYKVHQWRLPTDTDPGDGPCPVPEPKEITAGELPNSAGAEASMEPWESALVRLKNVRIAAHFGPEKIPADTLIPGPNASNCDLNDDGKVDFDTPGNIELACSKNCLLDPECSDWRSYSTRGNYRVVVPGSTLGMQLNTNTVSGFDPYLLKGHTLAVVTGTMRHFSGGDLNWTIDTRCSDDLVYCKPDDAACAANPPLKPITEACVLPRTEYDPDEGTN